MKKVKKNLKVYINKETVHIKNQSFLKVLMKNLASKVILSNRNLKKSNIISYETIIICLHSSKISQQINQSLLVLLKIKKVECLIVS